MAKAAATPRRAKPPTVTSSDKKKQTSLLSFFSKKPENGKATATKVANSEKCLASPSSSPAKVDLEDVTVVVDDEEVKENNACYSTANPSAAAEKLATQKVLPLTPSTPAASAIKRPVQK